MTDESADDPPRRRASDRERWTDDRLDDFARLNGRVARDVAQELGEIDHLRDTMDRIERDTRERFDRVFDKLDRIDQNGQATNGRIQELERVNIAEKAARKATAEAVEERRQELERDVAENGWIRPTIVGALMAFAVSIALKVIGVA